MLKLVLNIERFSLVCFFNVVVKCILEPFQDIEKVGQFH
jgi:hypothetical protein